MMDRFHGLLREVISDYRARNELRIRQPPALTVDGRGNNRSTIFYLAPDADHPFGGIRVIYRHVDALNALGLPAAVLHTKTGFRTTWFRNATRIAYSNEITLKVNDILVVPEWYGPMLDRLPRDLRMVVFNQRAYDTFDSVDYDSTPPGAPYGNLKNLVGVLTVSKDNSELLAYAFPSIPIHITRNVIDRDIFFPSLATPKRQICYTTTRRQAERQQLLHILRARGVLAGWNLVPIAGRSEQETAEMMRESAICLSFSDREGFGLPPAEAMACGCSVVGYTGLAGREFFDPRYCTPIGENDLLSFARGVEAACRAYEADKETFRERGLKASRRVLSEYNLAGFQSDLRAFYDPLLASNSSRKSDALNESR